MQKQQLRPCHIQPVHGLQDEDRHPRVEFCKWLINRFVRENSLLEAIPFTDDSHASQEMALSILMSDENSHEIRFCSFQRQFLINVWAGIVGDFLIDPETEW